VQGDTDAPGALAEDGDTRRVTAEVLDLLADPLQRHYLVPHSEVRHHIRGGRGEEAYCGACVSGVASLGVRVWSRREVDRH
jgi:hypothetical protein